MAVVMERAVTDESGEFVRDEEGKVTYEAVTTYEGAVLGTYERNGYDDSDFYAIVWDAEEGRILNVQYGTTRAYTYGNYATVDATDEVKVAAAAQRTEVLTKLAVAADAEEARLATKGKQVVVVKGRKVAHGTEGVVFWRGVDKYKTSRWATFYRVGVETADGDRFFTAEENVEVVNAEQYETDEDALRIENTVSANTTSWRNAVRVGRQYVEV